MGSRPVPCEWCARPAKSGTEVYHQQRAKQARGAVVCGRFWNVDRCPSVSRVGSSGHRDASASTWGVLPAAIAPQLPFPSPSYGASGISLADQREQCGGMHIFSGTVDVMRCKCMVPMPPQILQAGQVLLATAVWLLVVSQLACGSARHQWLAGLSVGHGLE